MLRHALVIAVVLAMSCKKQPPKGDLPPAADWGSGKPPAGAAAPNPHAAPPDPHAAPPDPHAAPPNPHAGGAGAPGGPAAQQTPPKALEKQADGTMAMGPFSVKAPADWTAKPVTSNMRAADFILPGKAGDAELIVYYFGAGGAGSVEDNLDRWLKQFQQPDGKESRDVAKIEKVKLAGQDATIVSVTGRYVAPAMPGGSEQVDKADQALLAAIVPSPAGPYYFKLVGPKATLDAQAAAFRAMLDSLKVR
jgi:hypothetical protein